MNDVAPLIALLDSSGDHLAPGDAETIIDGVVALASGRARGRKEDLRYAYSRVVLMVALLDQADRDRLTDRLFAEALHGGEVTASALAVACPAERLLPRLRAEAASSEEHAGAIDMIYYYLVATDPDAFPIGGLDTR